MRWLINEPHLEKRKYTPQCHLEQEGGSLRIKRHWSINRGVYRQIQHSAIDLSAICLLWSIKIFQWQSITEYSFQSNRDCKSIIFFLLQWLVAGVKPSVSCLCAKIATASVISQAMGLPGYRTVVIWRLNVVWTFAWVQSFLHSNAWKSRFASKKFNMYNS